MKRFLPEYIKTILSALTSAGYTAYVVGGCVRDMMMGRTPHDYDVCTSALPEQVKEVFKNEKVIETGIKHGTVTVVLGNDSCEITTYRVDGNYDDNRRPSSVKFVDNITEDLSRRDFTINAMAYNPEVGLIDPFNGRTDLQHNRIVCVGNPDERFKEDALRILRALRFASVYNFRIDENTALAIKNNKHLLTNISQERINSEFCKIIENARLKLLNEFRDVFVVFIPEIEPMFGFNQNNPHHYLDVWQHTLSALDGAATEDLITKLAVFFHDIAKPQTYTEDDNGIGHFYGHAGASAGVTEQILKRMRFDNDTIKKVSELIYYHSMELQESLRFTRRMINKLGVEQLNRLLTVNRCDKFAQTKNKDSARTAYCVYAMRKNIKEILSLEQCTSLKDLAINGHDLIEVGFKEGREIGRVLNALLERVIEDPNINNYEALILLAKKV